MPPASSEMAPGVTDPLERQRLIEAAGHFADLGDAALRFEGERVR